ncbi:MAG: hypothetical protein JSW61_00560 [Candidatus Thorarchaeota archaeon]|nr:MAG: hypothetical protein JSW61_00560 [Candidatus Thorarchaeota archaeon]
MSFRRKKGPKVSVEQIETLLQDSTVLEFAGSGDPHEEYGKVRLLLENLKACPPDVLLFDGDFLAEPAYLKTSQDIEAIAEKSVEKLTSLLELLVDSPSPSLCVAGNYEILGSTYDAIEAISSDRLLDIGCDKTSEPRIDQIHEDSVFMDLYTERTTWSGGVYEIGGFALLGVEGSNPINSTFPGERSEENLKWAFPETTSKASVGSQNHIIATHGPPFGYRDRLGKFGVPPHLWGAQKGSVALRNYVDSQKPFMTVVGHIHEAFGVHVRSTDKQTGETKETVIDKDFGNRTKIIIGYDKNKADVSITLNKGTLEYWNWSRVRIAEEDSYRLVDIEGEWLDKKGRKKPFKKCSQIIDLNDAVTYLLS